LDPKFQHGIDLINQGSYFAAHDVLEEVWREIHGWTKPFYQGMVQVAISLHHHSTGNLAGAQSVMTKSRRNLAEFPASFCGVDVGDLLAQLAAWQLALANDGPYPPRLIIRLAAPEC
jgi:predicted metal-dependent hydrolase